MAPACWLRSSGGTGALGKRPGAQARRRGAAAAWRPAALAGPFSLRSKARSQWGLTWCLGDRGPCSGRRGEESRPCGRNESLRPTPDAGTACRSLRLDQAHPALLPLPGVNNRKSTDRRKRGRDTARRRREWNTKIPQTSSHVKHKITSEEREAGGKTGNKTQSRLSRSKPGLRETGLLCADGGACAMPHSPRSSPSRAKL